MVKVKCVHDGRRQAWVPESRAELMPKSVFDSGLVETRIFPVQKRVVVVLKQYSKFKIKAAEFPVFEGEIGRLEAKVRTSDKAIATLSSANHDLADELRGSMPTAVFSRVLPVGRNASVIRSKINDMMKPLILERNFYAEEA